MLPEEESRYETPHLRVHEVVGRCSSSSTGYLLLLSGLQVEQLLLLLRWLLFVRPTLLRQRLQWLRGLHRAS